MPPERIAPELTDRMPLGELNFLRGNPRRGDRDQLRSLLTANGQVEALVINRGTHTGVPNEIVAGNNRAQVMADLGWTECAVTWVDVDDTTLRKLAVSLNKASEGATWDDHALAELLASIAGESDLTGTGFDDAAYDELMRSTDIWGDQAAGFLGGLLGGDEDDDDQPAPAPRPAGGNPTGGGQGADRDDDDDDEGTAAYVTLSWSVLPDQRDIVRNAIRTAQGRYQTGTAAEALVELCDRFNRGASL